MSETNDPRMTHEAKTAEEEIAEAVPPVNVDVPYAQQVGDSLTCTMGNWTGNPTEYAYQWMLDGAVAGEEAEYVTSADDDGKIASCIVTATNAAGSTEAPPSNDVTVGAV